MSVRIHQIAKQVGMENKELLQLLQERGFAVTTASSAIDNINAEAIIEELKDSSESADSEKEELAPDAGETTGETAPTKVPEAPARGNAPPPPPPAQVKPPSPPVSRPAAPPPPRPTGSIIKSKEQLEAERIARETPTKPPVSRPAPVAPRPPAPKPGAGAPTPPAPPRPRMAPPPPSIGKPPPPPSVGKPPSPAPSPAPVSDDGEAPSGEDAAAAKPLRKLQLKPPVVVRDFANQLGLKPFQLIAELMEMKVMVGLNGVLEEDLAIRIAERHGVQLEVRHRGAAAGDPAKEAEQVDESALLRPRPPVVCILGHVDHGKTTLLDAIRNTEVTANEFGGITQHIGAYQIVHNDHKLTFLDTPGHAAFAKMRQRGAEVTDVAVLVVAADDGFMPQTDEALKFATRAQVSLLVAINKIDAKGANLDKVKKQMQDRGITPEDWGGEVITVPVSALKKEGIDNLLEMINLQAEIMELKAVPDGPAEGIIIESQIEQGRGPVASVIITRGTLKSGDAMVCGTESCRVRTMSNDQGDTVKQAKPGDPVKITGWSDAPETGLKFVTVKNDREAKRLAEEALDRKKAEEESQFQAASAASGSATVEDLFAAIESTQKKTLQVVVKADARGSVEAVVSSIKEIKSDKVSLSVVSASVGMVSKKDVEMANASGAVILGFNVRLENGVQGLAKHHGVSIYHHNIIYELIDLTRDLMADLLEPEYLEKKVGAAQIRQIFPIGRTRVAGCMVTEGQIRRDAKVRLIRNGEVFHSGRIDTLRRFKETVTEVRAGYECGAVIEGNPAIQEGDLIECLEIEKLRPSL